MHLKKLMFLTSCVIVFIAVKPTTSMAVGMESVSGMEGMAGMEHMESVEFCYGPDCPLPPDQWADEFPDCSGGYSVAS